MKLEFSRKSFRKILLFNENPFGGNRVVTCGRTDGPKDVTKLTVAFRNFVEAPKNDTEKNLG